MDLVRAAIPRADVALTHVEAEWHLDAALAQLDECERLIVIAHLLTVVEKSRPRRFRFEDANVECRKLRPSSQTSAAWPDAPATLIIGSTAGPACKLPGPRQVLRPEKPSAGQVPGGP
jgi:hypothetical protein